MSDANKMMVEFLVDEYADAMRKQNEGGQNPPFDVEAQLNQLNSFRQFARDYLDQNRPQQLLTNIDGNYGVQLTNLKQFLIGVPIEELKGTMQPYGHVGVTGAQTARDMQQAGAQPITGASNLIPPSAVNFEASQPAQNMTHGQPEVRYDANDPRTAAGT